MLWHFTLAAPWWVGLGFDLGASLACRASMWVLVLRDDGHPRERREEADRSAEDPHRHDRTEQAAGEHSARELGAAAVGSLVLLDEGVVAGRDHRGQARAHHRHRRQQ
eukprot:scaffold69661_cov63-Phaeocystis_antarctica.AAC.1